MAHSKLTYLDISNNSITDEYSLKTLARSIGRNRHLETLNLDGIVLRKPFLKSYLETGLQTNITMSEIMGKIPPDTI